MTRSIRRIVGSACVSMLPLFGCSAGHSDGDSSAVPEGFVVEEHIDEHVVELARQLTAAGTSADLLAWAGRTLLTEDYAGAFKPPRSVLASYMGNDLDLCRFGRHLLSTQGIPTRFAIQENTCRLEAWMDEQAVSIPTSIQHPDEAPQDWVRVDSIPAEHDHVLEIHEVLSGDPSAQSSEALIARVPFRELARGPMYLDYVQEADDVRLRVRSGYAGSEQTWLGQAIGSAGRHEIVFEYTRPGADEERRRRILFDADSAVMNQAPDVEQDVYAVWFGSSVVAEPFVALEMEQMGLGATDATVHQTLYLRALELALETDHAAWKIFESEELQGAATINSARILIAAQEKRLRDHDGLTPSLDLLRNERHIVGSEDAVAAQVAIGWSDALVEGAVLRRATNSAVVSVPEIFAALYQEEPADVFSREDFYEAALTRLAREGVTEEGIVFRDERSGAYVEVILVGADLLIPLEVERSERLRELAGERSSEVVTTPEGVVLGDSGERGWLIELLMLDAGADLNYRPTLEHIESPQSALATPSGSVIEGTATYLQQDYDFTAIARLFEDDQGSGNPDDKTDVSDWQLIGIDGRVTGGDRVESATARIDEIKPRILQIGASPSTTARYEHPLWVTPAVAAGMRDHVPLSVNLTYETGGAADYVNVDFELFSNSRASLTIDGIATGVEIVTATDQENQHALSIARYGLTRLILGLTTPAGTSQVSTITTPRSLRLRGRVMSYRNPQGEIMNNYAIGVADADIGGMGTSWPDGAVDLRVPDTSLPTLSGSIAILVDTSFSMEQPADPGCTQDCSSRIEAVLDTLQQIIDDTPGDIELAVWGFVDDPLVSCDGDLRELAGWSLSRASAAEVPLTNPDVLLTSGTPLTSSVQAAVTRMQDGTWGTARRLIVLADGANDCPAGLDSVALSDGVEIHTIGVGLEAGGVTEQAMMDLAARAGGSYARATNGQGIQQALSSAAALPFERPEVRAVETEITAAEHLAVSVEFPVDQNDVTIYLDEAPDRERPGFVAIQPQELFPDDRVDVDANTRSLIEEHRAARPDIVIVLPDRAVHVGAWPDAFGWLEIQPQTGVMTSLTSDGLHGAGPVYLGATVVGLWSGSEAVIGNFSGCVLTAGGCGENIDDIRQNICSTSGTGPALGAIAISFLGTVFTSADGFLLDQSYATGLSVVNKLCSTEFDLSNFALSTAGNASSANLGDIYGGAVGFGYSVVLTVISNAEAP